MIQGCAAIFHARRLFRWKEPPFAPVFPPRSDLHAACRKGRKKSRAAALRRVELIEPRSVIGKTTVESIQSGVIYGYSAMIDGMCDRIEDVIGEPTVIATGGLADLIAPYADAI